MRSFVVLALILVFWRLVSINESVGETLPTLCSETYIHAADRLPNDTYRVYRGKYYWELIGLPDRVAKVKGPFEVWYRYMSPNHKYSSIMTIIGGDMDGFTYKFEKNLFWCWNSKDGKQRCGDKLGWDDPKLPVRGFDAVLNDGDLDQKGYPMLIAFAGVLVYYFDTRRENWRVVPNTDPNGNINGAFGEKFPPDLTAAMPFKSINSNVKYYVYLFRKDEHCFRPVIGEEGCKEWRKNKELFGCLGQPMDQTDGGPIPPETSPDIPVTDKQPEETIGVTFGPDNGVTPEQDAETPKPEGAQSGAIHSSHQNFVLLLFVTYLIQNLKLMF